MGSRAARQLNAGKEADHPKTIRAPSRPGDDARKTGDPEIDRGRGRENPTRSAEAIRGTVLREAIGLTRPPVNRDARAGRSAPPSGVTIPVIGSPRSREGRKAAAVPVPGRTWR